MEQDANKPDGNSTDRQVKLQRQPWLFFLNLRLHYRLILIMLSIMVPIFLLANLLLTDRAEASIRSNINKELQLKNNLLLSNMHLWIGAQVSILNQLASLDEMIAMRPEQQTAILKKTNKAFPNFYLIHTMGVSGMNIARSDGKANIDYSDREYFKRALAGAPISFQVLIGRTSNQPALVVSVPIRNSAGKVVGVLAGVSELDVISNAVIKVAPEERQTRDYIVDANNQVVVHTEQAVAAQMTDYSSYPPVAALRQGRQGAFTFVDDQGRRWLAYLAKMENGWGIVSQVEETDAFASVSQFRRLSWFVAGVSIFLLVGISYFSLKRSLRPIAELTAAAKAIAAGDLSRSVTLQSSGALQHRDEVGELASAFRSMTHQLRASIASLEKGIAERTRMVEITADVSRRLSMILDQSLLVREVVNQLQQAFNYYHVHIYLFDDARENLLMVSGSGEPGRIMLARGHKIPRGKGLVGRAAQTNQAVVVSNTLEDSAWLPNVLLPDTKAEVAAPIAVGGDVLGVLDVQQNVVGGLTQLDVELIQSIANQVAIAIQNARAFSRAQQRAEQEKLAGEISQKIQRAVTIDDVLKVAVGELSRAIGARHAVVEITANPFAEIKKPEQQD